MARFQLKHCLTQTFLTTCFPLFSLLVQARPWALCAHLAQRLDRVQAKKALPSGAVETLETSEIRGQYMGPWDVPKCCRLHFALDRCDHRRSSGGMFGGSMHQGHHDPWRIQKGRVLPGSLIGMKFSFLVHVTVSPKMKDGPDRLLCCYVGRSFEVQCSSRHTSLHISLKPYSEN